MSEKRRGLGRGLGALIPSGPAPTPRTGDRPVDVFFPERDQAAGEQGFTGSTDGSATAPADAEKQPSTRPADDAGSAGGDDGDATETADATVNAKGSTNGGGAGHTGATAIGGATENGGPSSGVDSGGTGVDGLVPVPGAHFAEVPVTRITPNPRQPRTVFDEEALAELVHSIREIGVLQPVVVRPVGQDQDGPRYELVMGERRWRATQEAGLDAIPAIIRETTDDDLLRDALLENLHRSQLNPLEEAAAYQQLLDDFGCTHDELAQRIGRSRPQISNTLRLMKLPPLVQRRVAAGVLSAGHARALLGLADGAAMERLAQRIVAEGLSVRATEEVVALGGDDAPEPARRKPRAGDRQGALDDLATRLSDRLDTRVRIALGQRKGKLTVEFASVEDLNRILGELAPDVSGVFRSN